MPPKELTDSKARRIIKERLLEQEWTKEAVDDALEALEMLFGPWTWATVKIVEDLNTIFKEMTEEFGEAPDEDG